MTEGSEKLAEAIGDAEAVICATGFRYSWDIFAPWKVSSTSCCCFDVFLQVGELLPFN